MNLRRYLNEALRQLTSAKLRAFLAILGILVGTASVVAMVSIGELAEQQILAQFEQLGINLLSVSINPADGNPNNANPNANLSLSAANNATEASPNILLAAPSVINYSNLVYQGHELSGSSVGLTPAMFDLAHLELQQGRLLSFLDADDYFCLIGQHLAQTMTAKTHTNPIGQQIQVGNTLFTIVGILKPWPTNWFFNVDFNESVLIPITTALAIHHSAAISNLALRIHHTGQLKATEKAITAYIQQHTVQQQVYVHSPKSIIDSMRKSASTMTLLLSLIGSISLLVGGIGVMNIMLVSVAERHKEIGIRLAIGARRRDIQLQFLTEAVTLSIVGGLIGMVLGILITLGVSLYSDWHFTFFILPPLIGFMVSVLVGIFFGFYPAYTASQLDPIRTLRSD